MAEWPVCDRNKDKALLRRLLADGVDPNGTVGSVSDFWVSFFPLHIAAYHGLTDCCAELLKAGARVDPKTRSGNTPLLLARPCGIPDPAMLHATVELLLAAGANVNATSQFGSTRLDYAAIDRDRSLAKVLLRAGARIGTWRADPEFGGFGDESFDFGDGDGGPDPGIIAVNEFLDRVVAVGGWDAHCSQHRARLVGLVGKLSAKHAHESDAEALRVLPADAAGHVVAFWTPPGGY